MPAPPRLSFRPVFQNHGLQVSKQLYLRFYRNVALIPGSLEESPHPGVSETRRANKCLPVPPNTRQFLASLGPRRLGLGPSASELPIRLERHSPTNNNGRLGWVGGVGVGGHVVGVVGGGVAGGGGKSRDVAPGDWPSLAEVPRTKAAGRSRAQNVPCCFLRGQQALASPSFRHTRVAVILTPRKIVHVIIKP